MRIAKYRDTYSSLEFIRAIESEKYMGSSDIRVSEYIDVEFTMIKEAVDVADAAQAKRHEAKDIIENYKKSRAVA
jgi:hypothetical protein